MLGYKRVYRPDEIEYIGAMKQFTFALVLAISLSACQYSNTFKGTFNGAPASMKAYSKNVNKYCVALNITAGNETKSTYISAQSVFDPNDFLKPMSFNTKGAECGVNLDEYLVGTRNTTVMNISLVTKRVQVSFDYCRYNTYKNYRYQEEISFEMKKNSNDETVARFSGLGEIAQYIDEDHPVGYGPIFYCGNGSPYPPYPYPYPFPRP